LGSEQRKKQLCVLDRILHPVTRYTGIRNHHALGADNRRKRERLKNTKSKNLGVSHCNPAATGKFGDIARAGSQAQRPGVDGVEIPGAMPVKRLRVRFKNDEAVRDLSKYRHAGQSTAVSETNENFTCCQTNDKTDDQQGGPDHGRRSAFHQKMVKMKGEARG